jgi:hypothetical protein
VKQSRHEVDATLAAVDKEEIRDPVGYVSFLLNPLKGDPLKGGTRVERVEMDGEVYTWFHPESPMTEAQLRTLVGDKRVVYGLEWDSATWENETLASLDAQRLDMNRRSDFLLIDNSEDGANRLAPEYQFERVTLDDMEFVLIDTHVGFGGKPKLGEMREPTEKLLWDYLAPGTRAFRIGAETFRELRSWGASGMQSREYKLTRAYYGTLKDRAGRGRSEATRYLFFGPNIQFVARREVEGKSAEKRRARKDMETYKRKRRYRYYQTPLRLFRNMQQMVRDGGQTLTSDAVERQRAIRMWGSVHVRRWKLELPEFIPRLKQVNPAALIASWPRGRIKFDRTSTAVTLISLDIGKDEVSNAPFDTEPECIIPLDEDAFIEFWNLRGIDDYINFKRLLDILPPVPRL